MSTHMIALIVGDHEALDAVCSELESRGDDVRRVPAHDTASWAAAERVELDDRSVQTLVIGCAADPEGRTAIRTMNLINALSSALHDGSGRVVLLSGRDYLGWPGRAAAAVDLAGTVALARSLALELGPRGITVNVVCPPTELGAVEATEDPWEAPPPPPTGPVGTDDIAYAVGFLTSPDSGYITGQVVHVSGGLSVLSSLSA